MKRSPLTYWQGLLAFVLLALLGTTQAVAQGTNGDVDEQEAAVHYSLYYENYKNQNYEDALPDLRWILEHAPGFPGTRDKNFERAIEIYEALAEQAEDPALKRAYLDTALVMFDRAVPTIKDLGGDIDEFQWKRDKGNFILNNDELKEELGDTAIKSYIEMYHLDPGRVEAFYLDVIFRHYYSEEQIENALNFLREMDETRGDEPEIQQIIEKYTELFPATERMTFYERQLANDPDNVEVMQRLLTLYIDEEMRDEMIDLANKLLDMDPTESVLRLLLKVHTEDDNYDTAREIFEQMEAMPDVEMRATDYYNMGIALQNEGRFGEANQFYQKALDADPDFTAVRQARVNLYATAVSMCSPSERKDFAIYWLLADLYSAAGDAAGAGQMRRGFPTAEDIFYVPEWEVGKSIPVSFSCRGLTISGTTTIRAR